MDYEETFSPTARLSTVRVLLCLVAQNNWCVKQLNIKTAYLNANVDEEIYMKQPEGFEVSSKSEDLLVCELQKSLYGLKQSGRNWYFTLKYLESIGFVACVHDCCLFVRNVDCDLSVVCVWVDDIIYCGKSLSFLSWFEDKVMKVFQVSDCCELSWFLGMKIDKKDGSIISQKKYIMNLIKKFGMSDCKSTATPMVEKQKFCKGMCPVIGSIEHSSMSGKDYRGLVGSLNYMSMTSRPDIAQAAHVLSAFLENPGEQHWIAAKHVLR